MHEFRKLLTKFLTLLPGERVEDLLSGRPWEDPEGHRLYFTMGSLKKFLKQEGVRDMTTTQIASRIRDLGGGNYQFNFKNQHTVYSWWVPWESGGIKEIPFQRGHAGREWHKG